MPQEAQPYFPFLRAKSLPFPRCSAALSHFLLEALWVTLPRALPACVAHPARMRRAAQSSRTKRGSVPNCPRLRVRACTRLCTPPLPRNCACTRTRVCVCLSSLLRALSVPLPISAFCVSSPSCPPVHMRRPPPCPALDAHGVAPRGLCLARLRVVHCSYIIALGQDASSNEAADLAFKLMASLARKQSCPRRCTHCVMPHHHVASCAWPLQQ